MSGASVANLPGAALATDPVEMQQVLAQLLAQELGAQRSIVHCRSTLRRSVPEKRCVFEWELTLDRGERRRLLAKVYNKDQGERAHQILTALRGCGFASGACLVPKPLAYDATRRLSLLEWVDGRSLRDILLAGEALPSMMDHTAHWIAMLHASGIRAGRDYDFQRQLHTLARWGGRIASLLPDRAALIEALLQAVEQQGAALGRWQPGPTHRDFSPDHLLWHHGVLTGIDFDEFCQFDRLFDIAHFVVHMKYLGLLYFGALDRFNRLSARFVGAYRAIAPEFCEQRLSLYESIACLKLAHIVAAVTRPAQWMRLAGILLEEARLRLITLPGASD